MEDLLLLARRIPFPSNTGDKLRVFNLLKHLARCYRIHLGAFIDDPADWHYVEEVRNLCADTHFVALHPSLAKLKSLVGLGRDEALTLPYYRSAAMQAWVDQALVRSNIRRVLVSSSAMAQYVVGPEYHHLHRVIDFVDVEPDRWMQFSQRKTWPINWGYRREGRALLRFERAVAADFAAAVFASAEEAKLFCRLAPEVAARTTYISNGVDTDFFTPGAKYPNPYQPEERVLVFIGAMDYGVNVDAVCWFAREIFPVVQQEVPRACFAIVGVRPTAAVRRLASLPHVQVIGAVRDIRPYLAHASAAVVPLRMASGIQNKILEAMAMAKPVLATRPAMEGIVSCSGLEELVADEPRALIKLAVDLLKGGDSQGYGILGRIWVRQYYDWNENLRGIEQLLQGGMGAGTRLPRATPTPGAHRPTRRNG